MISSTQAQQYLDALGIGVPVFVIDLAIAAVAEAEPAMDAAGYSETQKTMVQLIAVTLIASLGASSRRLTSQTAPSGAARSFSASKSTDLAELYRLLASYDTAGTVVGIVPPNPAAATMFFVAC